MAHIAMRKLSEGGNHKNSTSIEALPKMPLSVPDHVLTVPRDSLAQFFLVFARFEFACKAVGYSKSGRFGNIEVDWEKVSRALGTQLFESTEAALVSAIKYLTEKPPKLDTYKATPRWQERPAPARYTRMQSLLFYVQGVRNNLVHGGKFQETTDPVRDMKLLEASMIVIEACLNYCPGIRVAFVS